MQDVAVWLYYAGGALLGGILAVLVTGFWTTARGWGADEFLVEGLPGFFILGTLAGCLLTALVGRRCATAIGVSLEELARRKGLFYVGVPLGAILGLLVVLVSMLCVLSLWLSRQGAPEDGRAEGDEGDGCPTGR